MRKVWRASPRRVLSVAASTVLVLALALASSAQDGAPQRQPSTDFVVKNLMQANARRAAALRSYQGKRFYRLDYTGLFGGHAELQVEASYRAPNEKNFRIVSETGSKLLIRQVLLKLLQSEREAQEEKNRKALEISPANYIFNLANTEHTADGDFYVLTVKPKSKSKFVYNGTIWVDAKDFAVTRMEGAPASNPSFWVKNVEVQYQWAKFSGYWLPVSNHSVTNVRWGGKAVLNITYSDYRITAGNEGIPVKSAEKNPVLPDPSNLAVPPHF